MPHHVQDGNIGLVSINFTALVGAKAFVEKIEKWRGDLDCHPQGRKTTQDNAQRPLYFARYVTLHVVNSMEALGYLIPMHLFTLLSFCKWALSTY